jgi:hypothetical protein
VARSAEQHRTEAEQADKRRYHRLLAEGGREAVYAELFRTSLGWLCDMWPWEAKLRERVAASLPAERRAAIEAEVEATWESEAVA